MKKSALRLFEHLLKSKPTAKMLLKFYVKFIDRCLMKANKWDVYESILRTLWTEQNFPTECLNSWFSTDTTLFMFDSRVYDFSTLFSSLAIEKSFHCQFNLHVHKGRREWIGNSRKISGKSFWIMIWWSRDNNEECLQG